MDKQDRASLDSALQAANTGQQPFRRWITRIERYGITDSLVSDLNEVLQNIEVRTWPALINRAGKFHVGLADMYSGMTLPRPDAQEEVAALQIARLISANAFRYLRRCKADDCGNYFARGWKAEWCSDNCGSRVRNAEMRKRRKKEGDTM
jgi:predicted RNA-binding Zn ribbon-like protein